jgi:hypothetical protein
MLLTERMNRIDDGVFFPRLLTITNVEWDDQGFRAKGGEARIRWNDVVQVAYLYEIHPIATIDWDYVAFQLREGDLSVWVDFRMGDAFCAEIERRFTNFSVPRMADWKDEVMCIRSYSIWPKERIGEPLYVNRRRNWWSWTKSLALPKRTISEGAVTP